MPMLNLRYVFPDALIDINRLPELAGIACSDKMIRVGAMTRQRDLERDPDVTRRFSSTRLNWSDIGRRAIAEPSEAACAISILRPNFRPWLCYTMRRSRQEVAMARAIYRSTSSSPDT